MHIYITRSADEIARIKGLYSVLNHIPEKLHKISNRMGDTVSRLLLKRIITGFTLPYTILNCRTVSLSDLDHVSSNYDKNVKQAKADMDALYMGELTPRNRQALAFKIGVMGFTFANDNVGKVSKFSVRP